MIVPASELVRTIQFGMNYFTIPMHFFALNSKIYYIKNETVTFYAESKKKVWITITNGLPHYYLLPNYGGFITSFDELQVCD